MPAWNVVEKLLWQLGPVWKATWRPKYDSRPEIDYNLLFRWFVGLATDDAGVEPRGVFTARVDARKVKGCPRTRSEGPRCEIVDCHGSLLRLAHTYGRRFPHDPSLAPELLSSELLDRMLGFSPWQSYKRKAAREIRAIPH